MASRIAARISAARTRTGMEVAAMPRPVLKAQLWPTAIVTLATHVPAPWARRAATSAIPDTLKAGTTCVQPMGRFAEEVAKQYRAQR